MKNRLIFPVLIASITLYASQSASFSYDGRIVQNGTQPGAVNVGSSDANSVGLFTNATQRLTVNSSGNVGIGSTNPQALLHLYSSSGVWERIDRPAGNYGLIDMRTSGSTRWTLGMTSDAESGTNLGTNFLLNRYDDSGNFLSPALYIIRNSGNVGIGTSSPANMLEISKSNAGTPTIAKVINPSTVASSAARFDLATGSPNSYALMQIYESGTGNGTFGIATGDGVTGGLYLSAGSSSTSIPIVFTQGGSERMRINNLGSVELSGAIVGKAVSLTGITVDFSTGNLQYTSSNCQSGIILKNMKSGGTYTLAVQGSSGGTCGFTAYSDNGTTVLTLKAGANSMLQTASKHAIFTFMVMGSTAYVTSIDNY